MRNPKTETTTTNEPPSAEPAAGTRRRFSKIARLPRDVRELLNVMLRDGAPYSAIAQKLAERGHTINVNNISRWHSTGYEDWLHDQSCLEEMRLRLDFASDVVNQQNGDLIDAAGLRIAVTRMYSLLTTFEPSLLRDQIANQPAAYTRILNSLCKLTEASIKCERHRLDQQHKAQQQKLFASLGAPQPAPGSDPK
jgi:hypothetical protein